MGVMALSAGPYVAQSAAAPGQHLRVAVMGVNGRGMKHIQGFLAQPNVEIAYVCDVDSRAVAKGLAEVEKTQKNPAKGIVDFRAALDDKDVDILSVAAPNHWHAPATILACDAGKHVYVEKPGSHDPQEAGWMVAAANRNERLVQLGTQRRSWRWIQEAIQRVHEGEIGRVTFARTWYNNSRPSIGRGKKVPVPGWLNYDLWQGPVPRRDYKDNLIHYNWHWHWHWGNGELGNNGIHALDVARWGLAVDRPISVSCGGGRYHFDDDQETPDIYRTTYDFGEKGASWESHSHHPYTSDDASFGIQFYGSEGQLIISGNAYKIVDPKGKVISSVEGRWNDSDHFGNLVQAIRDGEPLTAEIDNGQKSTLLCHLGNIAWRTRSTLRLNADGEVENGGAAGRLMGREYAAGWEDKLRR